MFRKMLFILVGILLLGTTTTVFAQQSEDEVAAWREDLAYLRERMESIHPNLYWRFSETVYGEAFDALDADLPGLTREQTLVRLMQIVALVDGHTQIYPLSEELDFHEYPIRLYQFSDGLFVVDAQPPYENLIGAQVLGVGNTNVAEAFAQVSTIAPYDSAMTKQVATPLFFSIAEVLQSLGLIEDVNAPGFRLRMPDGSEQVVEMQPIEAQDYQAFLWPEIVGLPQRDDVLYLERRNEPFWSEYLEEENTLYMQYNRVTPTTDDGTSLRNFVAGLRETIAERQPERFILDMRHNPGGDNHTFSPLMTMLTQDEYFLQPGQLFVIIGRQTFSAATNFVTDLQQRNPNTIFVGEPTGGSPNLYGDTRPVLLPNSGITVQVSSRYWQRSTPDDPRDALAPQFPIVLSSEDFFNGHDPVLEAILQ